MKKEIILNTDQINQKIARIAHQIIECNIDEKEVMTRCLFDTGCTQSMIPKNITDKKRLNKLSDKRIYRAYIAALICEHQN